MTKEPQEILKAVLGTAKELLDSKRATAGGVGLGIIATTGDWRSDIAVAVVTSAYTLAQTWLDSRKSPGA